MGNCWDKTNYEESSSSSKNYNIKAQLIDHNNNNGQEKNVPETIQASSNDSRKHNYLNSIPLSHPTIMKY